MQLRCWNVNGLRAVAQKGFLDWFHKEGADVVCLQEVKATPEQIDPSIRWIHGYKSYFHPAQKPGYSGVAVYTKTEPSSVVLGFGDHSHITHRDLEGRVIQLDFGSWVLINAYFPNSQREHTRLDFKLEFCQAMLALCQAIRAQGKAVVLCGDFNIAHEEIDLRNPKSNMDNAGFLPQERAWMSTFLQAGYVDTFRVANPGAGGHYTWWSYRPGVREKNVGWRLDYFCVDRASFDRVSQPQIQSHVLGSDHCPVGMHWDHA